MRVISLLASGTEIVCALGLDEYLVGRSHECDNPSWVRNLPACSSPAFDVSMSSREIDAEVKRRIRAGSPLYRIDSALIQELKPDLVIAQDHCEVCAVTPADMERSGCGSAVPPVLALTAGSLDGIFEGILRIAIALGVERDGLALIGQERRRLEVVRQVAAARRRQSVVILEWMEPLFVMANWGPELVEIANGEPLLGKKGEHSGAIEFARIQAADPDVIVVAPCGFTLERTLQERSILEDQPGWGELRAVRTGRVAFADGNLYFNRSGMTVAATAEIIAEILHGVVSGESTRGKNWCWAGDAP